jgi:PIN domain nuclease of toxin-antitoxin system
VILLDTHVWLWWVNGDSSLPAAARTTIREHEVDGLGVSIISCWEVAQKTSADRLALDREVDQWLDHALKYPGVHLLDLSLAIVQESVRLPAEFHRDPADRFLVATARVLDIALLTEDTRIRRYAHVRLA